MRTHSVAIAVATVAAAISMQPASAQITNGLLPNLRLETSAPWPSAGNGLTDDHAATGELILGRYTLPFLFPHWIFTASGEVQDTPTVQGDAVYVSDAGGSVWRIDNSTGKAVWQTQLPNITGNSGSYSRVSPAIAGQAVIVGDQASGTVFALSAATGKLLWKTVVATNQGAIITSSPVVANGTIYLGVSSNQEDLASTNPGFVPDFRGSVVALNATTGSIVWQTYVIPPGFTGGAVWSSNIAIDQSRGALYVTTGNNYSVPSNVTACQAAAKNSVQLDSCLPSDDHIDSIVSLSMATGAINWGDRFAHADTWTVSCITKDPATPCPTPTGLDVDFGSGANLFTIPGSGIAAVGAGQKSGAYFAVNRDTGAVIWGTQVSPGGNRGGVEWGTATDGTRIYVPSANSGYVKTTLIPSGKTTSGGFWSALDPATGRILWQTPTSSPAPTPSGSNGKAPPAGATAEAEGSVTVANGVMYGEDAAGNFVALDAGTGNVLRSFQSGGASIAAPAVVDGTLYWGSGYASIGATNNKLYAFWVGLH